VIVELIDTMPTRGRRGGRKGKGTTPPKPKAKGKTPTKEGRGRKGDVLPLSPSSVARSTRLSATAPPPRSPSPKLSPPSSPDSVARADRLAKRLERRDLPPPSTRSATGPLNLDDTLASAEDNSKVTDPPELCSVDRGPTQPILVHSKIRDFEYPVRTWSIVERPAPLVIDGNEDVDGGVGYEDPYHDFPTEEWNPPKIQPNVGGFYLEEILKHIQLPQWLQADYISYYTMWSQRGRGQYDDDSDLFSVYFPSGDQSRLYGFFNAEPGDWTWNKSDICQKCIVACWKLFHPGSYYLWVGELIASNSNKYKKLNTNRFRELRSTLGSVPLTFNVFEKRVISFIPCNDAHYVPYFACNVGVWVTKDDDEVSHDRPNCFVVELDSLYHGISAGLTNFFYFILEIARDLEIWVANFLCLKVGDSLPEMDFVGMAAGARERVKHYNSPFCDMPIFQPLQRARQNDDLSCGPFASLNVFAIFQAEKEHFVRLDKITSAEEFFESIIHPFWNLPMDEEADPEDPETMRLSKLRATSFRTYLLDIMLAKFHHISDTKALSNWGVLYLMEHGMEHFVPTEVLDYLVDDLESGYAPASDTTDGKLNIQLELMIQRKDAEQKAAAEGKVAATPSADGAADDKAGAPPAAGKSAATEGTTEDKAADAPSPADDVSGTVSSAIARLKIPAGAAEGKAAASPSADGDAEAEAATNASCSVSSVERKPAATPSSAEKFASELKKKQNALRSSKKAASDKEEKDRVEILKVRDGLRSSKKAASVPPKKRKSSSNSPTKKKKTPVEDKTSVGRIFNQLKRDAEKKKERSERIRRRRGVYLKRLKWKKTEEDRKNYARRYEGTFLSKEEAIIKKDKEQLQRNKYKLKVWKDRRDQLEAKFLQQKQLSKKEQKGINDVLNDQFPEDTPPPSDGSSVISLDSQLTSDTSDDENYSNQLPLNISIRQGKRLQKREDKLNRDNMRMEKREAAANKPHDDPGLELPEEVTQISKLRYIPQQKVKDWQELDFKTGELTELPRPKKRLKTSQGEEKFYPARYQSLMYTKRGKSEMGCSINCSWVHGVFNERYLELVREVGIKENNNETKWTKRRWIPVPVGSKMEDPPPKELLYPGIRCRYQQNDYNTCVYKSMASVFHFAGRKDVANYLSSIAHASGTPDLDAVTQVTRLCTEVQKRETVYRKIDYLKKEKAIARLNIYDPEPNPKLWILLAKDGGTSHAVGVIGDYVFDSNVPNAMKLSKETLDWCSNCAEGFTRIHMYVRFHK
jgi:hypothetical protein